MIVSGFTFIRNALKFAYPVLESIGSVLPLCDECIVVVGDSEDGTRDLIRSVHDPKIKVYESAWGNDSQGGRVLAEQTRMALMKCRGDWAFYIQADEIIHEDDREKIRSAMEDNIARKDIQGLLFDYVHFYGSYSIQAVGRRWYRREVRIIRNGMGIEPYKDAQGFRLHGKKIRAAHSGARIFHYGWVRRPDVMGEKSRDFARLWGEDRSPHFTYESMYGLTPFSGRHPEIMKKRVDSQDWTFDPAKDGGMRLRDLKYILSDIIEKPTGVRLWEFRNYILVR